MAAAGRSNQQIAQDLFVTIKTVETHLSWTYRKLSIAGRQALGEALAARDRADDADVTHVGRD
jgi:DNA-binding CsgD family transcriptional regulator